MLSTAPRPSRYVYAQTLEQAPGAMRLQVNVGGGLIGEKPWQPPADAIEGQTYACEIPGLAGRIVTSDPVPIIAEMLAQDGYPPGINFGLQTMNGDTLFIGLIGGTK